MGNRRGAYRLLVGRNDGKKPLGSRRRRWEGNIKMNLQEIGWEVMDRNDLAHVSAVMNLRVS
jgi:hypothetical protein